MTPEEEKFQREKAAYQHNCQQFRSLNQIMWQVPIIAMTLTGGLWFGVTTLEDKRTFQIALLLLAAAGNIGFIVVLTRMRYVMGEYLIILKKFCPPGHVSAPGTKWYRCNKPKTVVRTFRFLLGLSAVLSVVGIYVLLGPAMSPLAQDLALV